VSRRILVLLQQPNAGIDALGDHLIRAGCDLVVVAVADGEPIPDLDGFDGLVVLGGEMDVWQEQEHPWLVDEKVAIRAWVAGPPRPLLGICLGHQLLADALGGDVGPRDSWEVGIRTMRLTDSGVEDRMLGRLSSTFASIQWHGAEVRRVPDGAVVLATDERGAVQAMRMGNTAWGVQFHPEVGLSRAAEWGADPAFGALLDASDGAGAADRFPAVLAAASEEMVTITGTLGDALIALLEPQTAAADPGSQR
jgi:GMP synthase-like glutamine amidotransferase